MTAFPLAVAYVAIPLGMALLRVVNAPLVIPMALPWLLLAGIGTVYAMLFRRSGVRVKKRFVFEVSMFFVLITLLTLYSRDIFRQLDIYIPYVVEATPLVMIWFCGLWAITFGIPDRADFQRYGAALGLLCIIDLVAEVIIYQAVPTIRWLGNADILAGLMLVALCASLRPGKNDGGIFEPDQGRPFWRGLIMIGLLACMSRTGLFAAAWVVLCFGRGPKLPRVLHSLLCLGLIAVSFLLPTTASDAVRYTDYWLWVESLRLFTENPALLFTGFSVPNALPVTFPAGMAPIWEAATGSPAMWGAYLPQVPSFWLRLLLAWGIVAPLMFLAVLTTLLFKNLSRMGAGLIAGLFAQGMSTPLMFDPTMGAVIGLGFFLALSRPVNEARDKQEQPEEQTEQQEDPKPESTPAEEWNMRPL